MVGGSLIVSGPAYADSGSASCLFAFTGSPVVTISAFNTTFFGDFVTLSIGSVPGSCPCGGTASIEYAFHLTAPLGPASSGPWSASNSYSLSFVNLWPGGGGSFTVSAGVRITCNSPSGTTVRCRFASGTYTMPASFGSVSTTFSLPTNNGDTSFPNLPACNPAALRFAALSNDLMMVRGIAQSPPELQALIDGAPEQQPIEVLVAEPSPNAGRQTAPESAMDTALTGTPQMPEETTPSTTAAPMTTTPPAPSPRPTSAPSTTPSTTAPSTPSTTSPPTTTTWPPTTTTSTES